MRNFIAGICALGIWSAAVLPALLTCFGGRIENDVRNPLVVKFGGEAGAEPPQTSTLYLTPTGF